jgi:hypothetical protein
MHAMHAKTAYIGGSSYICFARGGQSRAIHYADEHTAIDETVPRIKNGIPNHRLLGLTAIWSRNILLRRLRQISLCSRERLCV